ncbi:cobyric acid synthase [Ktedonospora formicarum]|uniref:Cobyric acid synthase n=1 Tax=Ktedonospora formicarum TaxID=2778364 RepID=A0A8J3HY83_9CHLR|nr:cobyric acid synthase [Ktedonospora formicarum]GHO46397.1 cobyric acid synthase CobQ [Ktedonospora formicarum]
MERLAPTLMVQGTASTVGKSTLVTGLCRLFAREGLRVAPFKAQNMALNSFVTPSGGEIGRAQAVQAEAAGIEPIVEMNPILLKPEGNSRSQVIMLGRPLSTMEASEYYRQRSGFEEVVKESLANLRREFDLVLIEGAGSPVEINLARYDLVNMRVARWADASVLLAGDIDRGGIFASMLGTLMLLEPEDRRRVKGLIVNKFRGDLNLWRDGERMLAERADVPVLGTVPYMQDLGIAEEDSVALDEGSALLMRSVKETGGDKLHIVISRFPYLSNYDEFDALAAEPGVRLFMVASPEELPEHVDMFILPGSKNTLADLDWLWRSGLGTRIRSLVREEVAILGICGGYQMLGECLLDPIGAEGEAGVVAMGLGLLPLETTFAALHEKVTCQSSAIITDAARQRLGLPLIMDTLHAYQIHLGRTEPSGDTDKLKPFFELQGASEGWLARDSWCGGCYLHGLFENDAFRHGVLQALWERRGVNAPDMKPFAREQAYDRLADMLAEHLDLSQLRSMIGL